MEKVLVVSTDKLKALEVDSGKDLIAARKAVAEAQLLLNPLQVTIVIVAYNRLDKTKRCVESVLKYTSKIEYQLILVDHGSEDGTFDYFKNIPHSNKRIIRITKNAGVAYGMGYIGIMEIGRYYVELTNDIIVTENWLENLIACAESDERIGMVSPMASNISNLQEVALPYKNHEEMQREAAKYNRSDPKKWQERLRLITVAVLYKKEVLMSIGFPIHDSGFFHDFGDDELTFRIRRMGYKAILAGDTWVCHDHDFRSGEGKEPEGFRKSLEAGKENFCEKFYGVDAWNDVNNYIQDVTGYLKPPKGDGKPAVLGIDVKCGTPILDIKNKLRGWGIFNVMTSAFTQNSNYVLDLNTICDSGVVCDREEFLRDGFLWEFYDYIVLDNPINRYHEPQKVLEDILCLAKRGAQIILPLANAFSFYEYLHICGRRELYNPKLSYNISLERLEKSLEEVCRVKKIIGRSYSVSSEDKSGLEKQLRKVLPEEQLSECMERMLAETYLLVLEKI